MGWRQRLQRRLEGFKASEKKDPFLPKKRMVENVISGRSGDIKFNIPSTGNKLADLLSMGPRTAIGMLGTAGDVLSRLEAGFANVGLRQQASDKPSDFFLGAFKKGNIDEFLKGIRGEKMGEFGDIIRATGFGKQLNEPLARMIGLGASMGMADLATKGLVTGGINTIGGKVKSNIANSYKTFTSKLRGDFIDTHLAPKLNNLINDAVNKFGKPIQNFSVKKLKIHKDIVSHIAKRKPDQLRVIQSAMKDSNDSIVLKINQLLQRKENQFKFLYKKAFRGLGNKDLINVDNTYLAMKRILLKNGFIDELGNATSMGKSATRNKTLGAILDRFEAYKPLIGQNKKIVGGLNKYQWRLLKDDLTNLYKFDRNQRGTVKTILDALHNDAEKAGLSGIKKARSLYTEYLDHIDLSSKFNEKKLDRIFNMSKDELRDLNKLEKYLGGKFELPAKDIVAARNLNKLDAINIDNNVFGQKSLIHQELKKAISGSERSRIKRSISDMIGDSADLDDIFNQLASFERINARKNLLIRYGGPVTAGILGYKISDFISSGK